MHLHESFGNGNSWPNDGRNKTKKKVSKDEFHIIEKENEEII